MQPTSLFLPPSQYYKDWRCYQNEGHGSNWINSRMSSGPFVSNQWQKTVSTTVNGTCLKGKIQTSACINWEQMSTLEILFRGCVSCLHFFNLFKKPGVYGWRI
uniref:Uncharacterized protein n=1 Tax=Sphaerodactylus townsendi TaxID=933632 RepID=A0ACB8FQF5_9SAUR